MRARIEQLERSLREIRADLRRQSEALEAARRQLRQRARQEQIKKVRREIAAFTKRVSPGHAGDLLAAMREALGMEDVDTAFLLTDGAPSFGDMVQKTRVRQAIRAGNRRRKIAIHCIAFGAEKESERRFMEGVARDAGGRWVEK